MKKTKNYAMPYPEQDDYFNVEDFQDMMVSVDNLMKKISDSGSQISSDAEHLYNQTKAQMDNIQKRMNAFTALRDGSTTGDAELKDIRVAYDGKEYGNAGEAVREQASDIHKALFGAGASIWSKAKSESKKYVVETKGICILNERFTAAGVVAKISRGTFAQNESTLNLDRECSAYIVEFEKNPGTVYMPSAETIKIVSTTKIIFEANGNARCWIPVEKGQYLAVDSTATAYTCESNHVPYMLYNQANKTLECRGFGSTGSIEPVDPYSLALEYKLEYDMDDTGLVKQIDANREAAVSLKEDLETKADNTEFKATLEELTAEVMCSRNVFDDSEYVGDTMPDYTQASNKTFYGDFKYLKVGTDYFVQVEYTDGTKGNEQLIWQYIYADGTRSSKKSLGTSSIAEKDVKGFSIARTTGYPNTDDGKQIAHVWMTSGSNTYEPYKVSVKSERLENLENDIGNAMISSNYMVQKNLLTDENITDNLQIQPYTTVADENYCSAYIPVKTGETLYVNYSLGTPTAHLCKTDKTKISWVSMPYSDNNSARNVGYKVETENVEYIRLSWNKTRSSIKGGLFFSTEPIRFKTSDEQFDKSYIPEVSTGRLDNWWYLKTGDSLGDSLTGQGFFQSWTKKYFGLKSFANHGVGGSKLSGDDVDSSRLSMWKDERINALNTDADFITVLGGQNDGNVTIGEITKTNYDTDTYVGALNTIIDKIYDHCKQGVIIIICTPFYVPAEGDDGERFDVLGNAVREVGKLRGIPVADFGGLCTADKKTADLYWSSSDRTHPNENFYRNKIASILISTMESIRPINWENVNYYD